MFCRIYTSDLKRVKKEDISFLIAEALQEKLIYDSIETENYFLDISLNDEYNKEKEKEFPDGFLYFKFFIEITFAQNTEFPTVINLTNKILTSLWAKDFPAVASCSYESHLIGSGGYKNETLPWV